MNIILNDWLGGSCCIVKSVLGGNHQRTTLEEEDQPRWVGGFSSHALFLPCDSLVQALRVTLIVVCTWDEESSPRTGCLVLSWVLILPWFFICKLYSGVVVSLNRRAGDGRIVEVAARVARDRSFRRLQRLTSFVPLSCQKLEFPRSQESLPTLSGNVTGPNLSPRTSVLVAMALRLETVARRGTCQTDGNSEGPAGVCSL